MPSLYISWSDDFSLITIGPSYAKAGFAWQATMRYKGFGLGHAYAAEPDEAVSLACQKAVEDFEFDQNRLRQAPAAKQSLTLADLGL